MTLALPAEVEAVFQNFLTCEFATLGQNNRPVTWPTLPTFWPERGQFVVASPVAMSQKAVNVRRRPQVSMLFSNAAGSGLAQPPAVLVQGEAHSPDTAFVGAAGVDPQLVGHLAAQGRRLMRLQPGMRLYLANRLTRAIMEWYFIRAWIFITPRRITWWPGGNFERPACVLEGPYVEADRPLPARVS